MRPIKGVWDGGRGPKRIQYALKEKEQGYEGCLKAPMSTGKSVEVKQFLKESHNPSLRGLWEGRENIVTTTIGEAPDSVRDLTRIRDLSRVNEKGY